MLRSRKNFSSTLRSRASSGAPSWATVRAFSRERNIRPGEEVYAYLLRRIERSIPAAREVVRRLDEAADEQQRGISRVLAREVLDDGTLELFE